jgi:predicted DsbA family dithiol-disulfide isomerase
MALKIDVYSDVICPWCYVGKRNLERAIGLLDKPVKVQVRFLPYELNPSTPPEGVDRKKYLESKYGDAIHHANRRLESMGKEVGIDFNFEKAEKIPNTFNAHRLIWLAGNEGRQSEVVEALQRAYFIEGKDIGDKKTLAEIGVAAGLKAEKVEKLLKGGEGTEEVREQEEKAYNLGISGVPHFVIDGKAEISGAQPVEAFTSILSQLAVTRH